MLYAVLLIIYFSKARGMKCVFLHGSGVKNTGPPTTQDTDLYWGGDKIEKFTPFCSSRIFNHDDTVNRGWDDYGLQKAYCEVAVGRNIHEHGIEDAIIFTHSMGNLVFASALRSGICTLGRNTFWYSSSAPWKGSQAAAWVKNLCNNTSSAPPALKWLAHDLHYCDQKRPGFTTQAYITMNPSYPGLADLRAVATEKVSGAICGTSALGLIGGKYSLSLEALSKLVGYGEDNDGMVGIDSCTLPGKSYHGTYKSAFYAAALNHGDTTCQNGNGDFGYASRQPCLWYSSCNGTVAEARNQVMQWPNTISV